MGDSVFTVSRHFNGILITKSAPASRAHLSRQLFGVMLLPSVKDADRIRVSIIGYPAMLGSMGSRGGGAKLRDEQPGEYRVDEISVLDGELSCLARQRPMLDGAEEDAQFAGLLREGFVLQVGPDVADEIGRWLPVLSAVSGAAAEVHGLIEEHMPDGRVYPHQCTMLGDVVARVLLDGVTCADAVAEQMKASQEPELSALLTGAATQTCLTKWKLVLGDAPGRSSALSG